MQFSAYLIFSAVFNVLMAYSCVGFVYNKTADYSTHTIYPQISYLLNEMKKLQENENIIKMTNVHANSWAMGLVKELNDTKNHIISSDMAVVIHDKFPKAQQHYLVLPKEDIPTIFHLKPAHLPLLAELHLLALNVIEVKCGQPEQFKIGFHAQPSMQRLHLHVISCDFVSDCLKTKKHWTSFNTALFLPYEDLCAELETEGCVKRRSKDEIQGQLAAALQCNQCSFIAKNMPNLKNHLLEHWTTQQVAR